MIRELVWIELEMEHAGGIQVVGPFGLIRPLARVELGSRIGRICVWLERSQIARLRAEFGGDLRRGLRKAIHLGLLALLPEQID